MGPQSFPPGWSFSPCRWPPPRRAGCCRCRGWWPRWNSMEPGVDDSPKDPKGPQAIYVATFWRSRHDDPYSSYRDIPIKNLQAIQIALLLQSPWFMLNVHVLVKNHYDCWLNQSRLMRHCGCLLHRSLHLGWTQNWMVSYAIKFQEFLLTAKKIGWSHVKFYSFT